MDKQEFFALVEDALSAENGSIGEADALVDIEGWDSIGALTLLAMIDDRYDAPVDASALWDCQTVGDLVRVVEQGLRSKKSA
jgi:acyl carrier protein